MKMKLWKIGAIIGTIWGLLGVMFVLRIVPQVSMLMPGETPPPEYVYTLFLIGMIVFYPLFLCVTILGAIFPAVKAVDVFVLILFPIYGALIGAGIGYLFEMLGI